MDKNETVILSNYLTETENIDCINFGWLLLSTESNNEKPIIISQRIQTSENTSSATVALPNKKSLIGWQ